MASAARLGQLEPPLRPLGFSHAARGVARLADDRGTDTLADVGVAHLEVGVLGVWTLLAPVNPECVGELVEMSVGAGQQVLCGDGGAALAASSSAAARAGLVSELGQIRAERMGVRVGESGERAEVVAAGASEPLRKHPRGEAEVRALGRH